jgi:hypothetical protein
MKPCIGQNKTDATGYQNNFIAFSNIFTQIPVLNSIG